LTLHGARGNRSSTTKRRAIATRWCGDDVTYHSKGMPQLYGHGLKEGDALSGAYFPQIRPDILASEVGARLRGPVLPDPTRLAGAMKRLMTADRVDVPLEF
jgi:hypothetical protein